MAASNLNLGKASGGVLNIQPADGTTTTNLVLPAINGTVIAADASGNVGLGVTPNSWHSSTKALQLGTIADSGVLFSSAGLNHSNVGVGANFYYDSTFTPKYVASYAASMYHQDIGNHYWKTAASGTAGGTITWKTTMTLDASANLIVSNHNLYASPSTAQGGALSEGSTLLSLYQPIASNTYFYVVNGSGPSGTLTGLGIARHSTTSRSINAAGTINASGADYAEYEYSNDITITKGQIVGFKSDGTLTDKYSESIRFAIKSTNPSIVGGDVWGTEEIVGKRPEQPVKTEEMTDEEFTALEEQYKLDLADFEARLEAERQKVDRIAYAGKVPVNVLGAKAGDYIIVVNKDDKIDGEAISNPTFEQYLKCVGRVNKILEDGRAEVAVIIH